MQFVSALVFYGQVCLSMSVRHLDLEYIFVQVTERKGVYTIARVYVHVLLHIFGIV